MQPGKLHIGQRSFDINISDNRTSLLTDAHNRENERIQQNRRRRRPPVQGSVRLSNTDSLGRANRIRQSLRSKVSEIMSSSLDEDVKKSLARNVQLQLDRVEVKIRQIRRRERAQQEEKRERRNEERRQEDRRIERRREEARRRRRSDMRERTTRIRRDFLYSARNGGFDPYDNNVKVNIYLSSGASAAVSFDVGGNSGVVADGGAPSGDGSVNMLI